MRKHKYTYSQITAFLYLLRFRNPKNIENYEKSIEALFGQGYCYYLAKIMEIIFYDYNKEYEGCCLYYPEDHFVFRYAGNSYDIYGIQVRKNHTCIPEWFLKKHYKNGVESWLHRGKYLYTHNKKKDPLTKRIDIKPIKKLWLKYKKENNIRQ